ncbi:heptaprenyl diphosphate synthase component II [Pseudogracilibacillus auburnensis]|uniref:Heptaprenyl diphosphate synthase component 2 n=1 Tax=Pseudogracilibacillus auburnensis TaxID=1494959 RepID=A0A2V3W322_9BACI|nr:heptaprenyl diphosphate synthase component II [Pseudogracilibacillus auburnensis]MBO1003053.1 heptaprenyl diphosphate synthase component II [Pseudogracilibacillus auburnensis]PXW88743.1 heptaprenyl diphosphate synthase [Pseudogracilibacillus auburnensis]
MKLANIYGFLKKDLQDIENTLTETIQAEHPILREASLQLLRAGGKRIRPVFVLLSAQFGDYKHHMDQVKAVAVSLELIHMATLVHDDVVDNAELRRGKPTIKHIFGNRVAMYTGDYILARALEVITTVHLPSVHRTLSKTLVKVVEGEIAQIEDKFNVDQGLRDYLRRIKRKTALLIATSCKLGAIASGATEKQANQLYRYGYNVGMSFQIIDDILDFTASSKELGKPTGSDLIQGNITLPVFYAMNDPAFLEELKASFQNAKEIDENNLKHLVDLLSKTDAIEQSYQLSNLYLRKALHAIKLLPNNKAKRTLQTIATLIGKRRS